MSRKDTELLAFLASNDIQPAHKRHVSKLFRDCRRYKAQFDTWRRRLRLAKKTLQEELILIRTANPVQMPAIIEPPAPIVSKEPIGTQTIDIDAILREMEEKTDGS